MPWVLDSALEQYRRDKFVWTANADFGTLKRNPKAWEEELRKGISGHRPMRMGLETQMPRTGMTRIEVDGCCSVLTVPL